MPSFFRPPLLIGRPSRIGQILFFCAGFADGAFAPYFALWAERETGIPIAAIGALFACYAGGELLATPLIGGIADRLGRRPVLIASAFGVGCGFLALSFLARDVVSAAVILIATGACESVLHPTIMTVIADSVPTSGQHRQFGLARVCGSAGRVLGPAVGAALALASLSSVFLAGGVLLICGAGLAALCLPETRPAWPTGETASATDDDDEGLTALVPIFTDLRLARLIGWVVLIEIASGWLETVLPLYAHDAGGLSPSAVGLLFSYAACLTVALQLPVGALAARRAPAMQIAFAGGLLAMGFVILAASASIGAMILAVTLHATAEMLTGPLIPVAIGRLAAPRRRAGYMAAASTAADLRDSFGPFTGTVLYAAAPTLPWLAGVPLAAVAALGLGHAVRSATTDAPH